MQVMVHGHGVAISAALKAHCERRVGFAARRFGDRLALVEVRLTDLNGPRGGEDLECRLVARMPGERCIVVRAIGGDAYASVDRAAAKASMAIARRLGQRRFLTRSARMATVA